MSGNVEHPSINLSFADICLSVPHSKFYDKAHLVAGHEDPEKE